VHVHDNIAAFEVNRYADDIQPVMIWYGPGGRLIKRVGDFSTLNCVVAPPTPTPATARSRRAERDPSTPNPVTVTPQVEPDTIPRERRCSDPASLGAVSVPRTDKAPKVAASEPDN
jgi:hypothetical protein